MMKLPCARPAQDLWALLNYYMSAQIRFSGVVSPRYMLKSSLGTRGSVAHGWRTVGIKLKDFAGRAGWTGLDRGWSVTLPWTWVRGLRRYEVET